MALPALQQRDEDQLRDVANALREEIKLHLAQSAITLQAIQDLEESESRLPRELVEKLRDNHRRQLMNHQRQIYEIYRDSVALIMAKIGESVPR